MTSQHGSIYTYCEVSGANIFTLLLISSCISLANHSRSYEFEVNFIVRLVDQSQHVLQGLANGRVFHGMASQRKTNFLASRISKLLIGAVAPLKNNYKIIYMDISYLHM